MLLGSRIGTSAYDLLLQLPLVQRGPCDDAAFAAFAGSNSDDALSGAVTSLAPATDRDVANLLTVALARESLACRPAHRGSFPCAKSSINEAYYNLDKATHMKKYFLNKMSTGKRLAKRSIVGTRVCAPGTDGIWYSGKIEFVKTASDGQKDGASGRAGTGGGFLPGLTTPARYTVLFDNMKDVARLGLGREFRETELIGRGFRTIADVKLKPGQKVFLTYNGRENAGEVIAHDDLKDEVKVRIAGAAQEREGRT
uniref:DUF4772 domain-containing protein n=1 Tax=Anopheles farauti TaxID=69004 RepID=A0A182QS49_9DIPT